MTCHKNNAPIHKITLRDFSIFSYYFSMIFLLFPHQLFRNITPLVGKKVLLIEEPLFFTQYQFHIQKIVMHRASMKARIHASYLHEPICKDGMARQNNV
jgi:hypothetical protein